MKIRKLIAVDCDGTLLNSGSEVSGATASFFRRIAQDGYLLLICSGRPFRFLKPLYENLGGQGPIICYNGRLIFDPKDPAFSRQAFPFPQEALRAIFQEGRPYYEHGMAESEQTIYLDEEDAFLRHFFCYEGMKIEKGAFPLDIQEDLFTAVYRGWPQELDQLDEIVKAQHLEGLYLHRWLTSPYAELGYQNHSKGDALRYVAAQLGVDKEDIIAFGDADNDISMLLEAGTAFRMKNSRSAKLAALFPATKDDNDHDGVAHQVAELFKL